MHFEPIIARWGVQKLAEALKLPVKNVRRWVDLDSIPAGWFTRVSDTGIATVEELLETAEAKERAAAQDRLLKSQAKQQAAA